MRQLSQRMAICRVCSVTAPTRALAEAAGPAPEDAPAGRQSCQMVQTAHQSCHNRRPASLGPYCGVPSEINTWVQRELKMVERRTHRSSHFSLSYRLVCGSDGRQCLL